MTALMQRCLKHSDLRIPKKALEALEEMVVSYGDDMLRFDRPRSASGGMNGSLLMDMARCTSSPSKLVAQTADEALRYWAGVSSDHEMPLVTQRKCCCCSC